MKRVTAENPRQTWAASKRGSIRHAAPAQSAQRSALTMPWVWWSGRTWRMRSSARQPQASTRVSTCAARLAWVVTTPLGRPVVPEV